MSAMALEHSARVAEARKVLAERPAEVNREQLVEALAHFLEAFGIVDTEDCPARADDLADVPWPVIEVQQAALAARDRALEGLLAIVNEAAEGGGSS